MSAGDVALIRGSLALANVRASEREAVVAKLFPYHFTVHADADRGAQAVAGGVGLLFMENN